MSTKVTARPELKIDMDACRSVPVGVTLVGVDSEVMQSLTQTTSSSSFLSSIFRVHVVDSDVPREDSLPGIAGRYCFAEGALHFTPHFPFEPGLSYRAIFDSAVLALRELSEALSLQFTLPRLPDTQPTRVSHIFPSSNWLPENLLRFYIRFSGSMNRGGVKTEIVLFGPDGNPASDVLYRAPLELWDRQMRTLTVLLDPGRLKRGVGPNRELGPPLKVGQLYTLVVGSGLRDLSGKQLTEAVHKRFWVTNAVRERIAIEDWDVKLPACQSREALELRFPRALDWGLLGNSIKIAQTNGTPIVGRVNTGDHEREWKFTPMLPWSAGQYRIEIDPELEDICGNSPIAPFDRPLRLGNDLLYENEKRSITFDLQ